MKRHYSIKINVDSKDVLSVTLPAILSNINNGQNLNWAILDIYGVGNLGGNINMLDFEKEVDGSVNGLLIDWDDLIDLSTKFDQILDLILIGTKQIENLKKYEIEEEMYSKCEYTIELIDSSYWLIHSIDEKYLELIGSKLSGIKQSD